MGQFKTGIGKRESGHGFSKISLTLEEYSQWRTEEENGERASSSGSSIARRGQAYTPDDAGHRSSTEGKRNSL
eukprot:3020724-Rhodomonas_salina.2